MREVTKENYFDAEFPHWYRNAPNHSSLTGVGQPVYIKMARNLTKIVLPRPSTLMSRTWSTTSFTRNKHTVHQRKLHELLDPTSWHLKKTLTRIFFVSRGMWWCWLNTVTTELVCNHFRNPIPKRLHSFVHISRIIFIIFFSSFFSPCQIRFELPLRLKNTVRVCVVKCVYLFTRRSTRSFSFRNEWWILPDHLAANQRLCAVTRLRVRLAVESVFGD